MQILREWVKKSVQLEFCPVLEESAQMFFKADHLAVKGYYKGRFLMNYKNRLGKESVDNGPKNAMPRFGALKTQKIGSHRGMAQCNLWNRILCNATVAKRYSTNDKNGINV